MSIVGCVRSNAATSRRKLPRPTLSLAGGRAFTLIVTFFAFVVDHAAAAAVSARHAIAVSTMAARVLRLVMKLVLPFVRKPHGGRSAEPHEQSLVLWIPHSSLIAVMRSKHYTGARKKSIVPCKNLMTKCVYASKKQHKAWKTEELKSVSACPWPCTRYAHAGQTRSAEA